MGSRSLETSLQPSNSAPFCTQASSVPILQASKDQREIMRGLGTKGQRKLGARVSRDGGQTDSWGTTH